MREKERKKERKKKDWKRIIINNTPFVLFVDLQFEMSSYKDSAKVQDDLQRQVQQLQKEAAGREALIQDLSSKLSASLERVEALEEQLQWKEVEFKVCRHLYSVNKLIS